MSDSNNLSDPQALVRDIVQADVFGSERSKYAKDGKIGVSDIGSCREYVRRTIDGIPWSDEENSAWAMASFMGTAVGDYVERKITEAHPGGDVVTQGEVTVDLDLQAEGGSLRLSVPGHPDIIVPGVGVYDLKTKNTLAEIRLNGAPRKHRWQVTLYAKALIAEGVLPPDALCALVYLDRSGVEEEPLTETWTYDPAEYDEIVEWLSDVVYAVQHGEEAPKDTPRTMCEVICPYYSDCRGSDTDVEGLITDPDALSSVQAILKARELEKEAKALKKSATASLQGVTGSTGTHTIRNVHVNATEYTTRREAYDRLDIRAIKKPKGA